MPGLARTRQALPSAAWTTSRAAPPTRSCGPAGPSRRSPSTGVVPAPGAARPRRLPLVRRVAHRRAAPAAGRAAAAGARRGRGGRRRGRLLVHGISREPFVRTLTGAGHTLGAAFHPGGFRPFLRRQRRHAVRDGGARGRAVRPRRPAGGGAGPGHVRRTGDGRRRWRPTCWRSTRSPTRSSTQVRALVAAGGAGPVADPGRGARRTRRRRACGRCSGCSPTTSASARSGWSSRFRILDAAAAAHGGEPVDWAALAVELGFTDQAHLTRAFTAVVGTPPATYRREA